MNGIRGMMSDARRNRVFQAPNPTSTSTLLGHPERSAAKSRDPVDEPWVKPRGSSTSLGMTTMIGAVFVTYEKLLAGETGAVFLFVV
jgi:hypothetical protein